MKKQEDWQLWKLKTERDRVLHNQQQVGRVKRMFLQDLCAFYEVSPYIDGTRSLGSNDLMIERITGKKMSQKHVRSWLNDRWQELPSSERDKYMQQTVPFSPQPRPEREIFVSPPKPPKVFKGSKTRPLLMMSSAEFYASEEWRTLRFQALERHGGRCQVCGRSPQKHKVVLHVDHVKPRSRFPELALDLNNLGVLCEDCNMGKGNASIWDYR